MTPHPHCSSSADSNHCGQGWDSKAALVSVFGRDDDGSGLTDVVEGGTEDLNLLGVVIFGQVSEIEVLQVFVCLE